MLEPASLYRHLKRKGISFYTGVPDSLLKDFCSYLQDHCPPSKHVIAANEGGAVAIAAGFHLATGQIPVVYMQNSGLGNALNPLVSLTSSAVYRIPLLLIIGWRGEPGGTDEPQHIMQGRITPDLLKLLDIPYWELGGNVAIEPVIRRAVDTLRRGGCPAAFLVRKGVFSRHPLVKRREQEKTFSREQALGVILELTGVDDLIVATTGKTSRELYELRVTRRERPRDFLTVGSMGHASSIAMGVALACPGRRVICLDGDGAMIMHLGALPVIGKTKPPNLVHILINNGVHESVGGQPTAADVMDFSLIAKGCGYSFYAQARDEESVREVWHELQDRKGPIFLEIIVAPGCRPDLGRPGSKPEENKQEFMELIRRVA